LTNQKNKARDSVGRTSKDAPLLTSACSSQVVYKQFPSFSLIHSYIPVDVQYFQCQKILNNPPIEPRKKKPQLFLSTLLQQEEKDTQNHRQRIGCWFRGVQP